LVHNFFTETFGVHRLISEPDQNRIALRFFKFFYYQRHIIRYLFWF